MITRRSALRYTLGLSVLSAGALVLPSIAQGRPAVHTAYFDPAQISLHWKDQNQVNFGTLPRLHTHLVSLGKRPLALMNAGIFEYAHDRTFQPQGLHIERGQQLRPLNTRSATGANFYLKPNGVFFIDGSGAHIARTPLYLPTSDLRLATQSGPLLFDEQGIHPAFIDGSTSRKIRNAVGVTAQGQVLFAMADQPINFWDFAHHLRDDLGCNSALYMDGSISSMWLAEESETPRASGSYAGLLAAVEG